MEDRLMTLDEAVDYLRVTKSNLYKLLQKGSIPASKVGGLWRFKKGQLNKWLDERIEDIPTKKKTPKKTKGRRVVVTGLGVVAPNGIGKDVFWKAIRDGISGIKTITRFDSTPFPTKVAGEIRDFDPIQYIDHKKARRTDRFVQLALASAKMAILDSKISLTNEDSNKVGVIIGTATAGQGWVFTQHDIFREKGYKKLNPFTAASTFPNAASAQVSMEFSINGPSDTISSGCSSSSTAIGYAVELIRNGRANVMLAGGAEALLYPPIFGTYCAAKVMSTLNGPEINTPRPFDKSRDGIILSEGGAVLILEELEHALKRNANIYAEIAGWASTCDGYSMMTMRTDGREAARAIRLALDDAGLSTKDINYIKAHGSGAILDDKIETKVIKNVFGKDAYTIPMSSLKSMLGHTQGACGAIEAIASVLALQHNIMPPTINYETPDPDCDLDYVPNQNRNTELNTILMNTFGFGGKNVAIIIKDYNK